MTFLNGVRKRRLIAKETSIANCDVLDQKDRMIVVQGIFVGIIIKASGATLKVTDLLFAFAFCKKINHGNWCPRSLAVCCLLISIQNNQSINQSINQLQRGRQTFRRRFVLGSLFVSPSSPKCYLQSETKIEPDLRLLFHDPLHRVFFGCCTTEGAQTHQPIL